MQHATQEAQDVLELQPVEQQQAVALRAGSSIVATPAQLLQIAVERGADLAYVEKLMGLQERWEANEARKAFVAAMTAFKAEPLTIFKRKAVGYETNDGDFVGYKHAQLSDVTDAVSPAMARHGLSFRWDVKQGDGRIRVSCVVTHQLGHSEVVTMDGAPDGSGKKNAIQQIASTVTYLQRYTLLAATGLSTKDEDDDGAGSGDPEPKPGRGQQDAGAASGQPEREYYPQARFDANLPSWKDLIGSGRKTADQMVAFIESRGQPLTNDQKRQLGAKT